MAISETTLCDIRLAKMGEHDLLEVVEIEEQSGLSRWGWDAYHAELGRGGDSLMFVARIPGGGVNGPPGRIAGFIAARLSAGELHINNVAVRSAERRRGVGRRLLDAALREAARLGARAALLEVRRGNAAAQALYERSGFRVVGVRKNYYSNPPEDALVMRAELRG
ncbi:MAG TPA: ribosomal protein S18-alanine N-acetyltransferase [Pyrinomonadaceae bacterium]